LLILSASGGAGAGGSDIGGNADPAPSSADLTVTRQIRDAGQLMGIDLLDHVIIGTKEDDPTGRGYYSFSAAGII